MASNDQVALVTGASRRVGRAIALDLAEAGFDIAIHYRSSAEAARSLAGEIQDRGRRVAIIEGDLAEPSTADRVVDQTLEALGRVDVLVNNASIFEKTPLAGSDAEVWDRMLRTNLVAPALLVRAAASSLRRSGRGRVVNLADISAERPIAGFGPYCASKAGLVSLTRCLAQELAPDVTVNAVAPGIAIFPPEYDDEIRRRLIEQVPMKREGTPEGIAAVVRFLVTAGDYITGQVIPVDGGRSVAP